MNTVAMNAHRYWMLLACAAVPWADAWAQSVSSSVVGFTSVEVAPDQDTVLAVTLHESLDFAGSTDGQVTVVGATATVSLGDSYLGVADRFADSHYLKVLSGTERGRVLPVVGNSSTTVTVALEGTSVLAFEQGDQLAIIPWWTLASLLPPSMQPAEQVSSTDLPPDRQLEILLYQGGVGTSLSPTRVFYLAAGGWKESTLGFPEANGVRIHPHAALVVRARSGGSAFRLFTLGQVNEHDSARLLETRIGGRQDNVLGLHRPVSTTLDDLWANGLDLAFDESASTAAEERGDELLVIDNEDGSRNRAPAATYFRLGGQWVRDEAGFPEAGGDEIAPESVLILRKAPSATGDPVLWIDSPNYLQ